jgi:predicted dehydrogenase
MKIGVIGAGVIGQLRARTVREHPDAELVGVVDVDESAARQALAGSGGSAYRDYHDMLERARPDAVIVSTPPHLHEAMVVAAFEAGAHVLCEKPLSNSVESCQTMLRAAKDRQRILAVGFNHRYYPAFRFLKDIVANGEIGALDHLRVFGGHDGLANFRADWMYKAPLSGGGAMMDVGIHTTDLTRFILGEITEVYGIASEKIWRVPGSEDNAIVIMKSAAGIPAIYQATWTEWKGYRVSVDAYGDRGMVRASYAPMFNLLITQQRPGARRRRRVRLYPQLIVREKLQGWQSTTFATFAAELADFVKRIRGRDVPLADGWAGQRAIEIAAAVHQSTATGTAVTLSRPVPA